MIRWVKWAVFTLLLAAVIYWAVVAYLPDVIMWQAMTRLATKGANTIVHGERATAAARTIVKPSPDLLYSQCVFDVSRRPLKVTTAAPQGTYWSVSFYAANTDNFFVVNDTKAGGKPTTIVIVGQGQALPPLPEGTLVVSAPTKKGVVLFRTLINDDAREPDLDRERRAANCEPL